MFSIIPAIRDWKLKKRKGSWRSKRATTLLMSMVEHRTGLSGRYPVLNIFLTNLVYNAFIKSSKARKWCSQRFINYNTMMRAVSVRAQLVKYLLRFKLDPTISCNADTIILRRCLVSGFFSQAAKLHVDGTYRTVRDPDVVCWVLREREFFLDDGVDNDLVDDGAEV